MHVVQYHTKRKVQEAEKARWKEEAEALWNFKTRHATTIQGLFRQRQVLLIFVVPLYGILLWQCRCNDTAIGSVVTALPKPL